jgi:hypothetical protein
MRTGGCVLSELRVVWPNGAIAPAKIEWAHWEEVDLYPAPGLPNGGLARFLVACPFSSLDAGLSARFPWSFGEALAAKMTPHAQLILEEGSNTKDPVATLTASVAPARALGQHDVPDGEPTSGYEAQADASCVLVELLDVQLAAVVDAIAFAGVAADCVEVCMPLVPLAFGVATGFCIRNWMPRSCASLSEMCHTFVARRDDASVALSDRSNSPTVWLRPTILEMWKGDQADQEGRFSALGLASCPEECANPLTAAGRLQSMPSTCSVNCNLARMEKVWSPGRPAGAG